MPYIHRMSQLAVNKKATFDYEVLEKIEAGIVLTGQEVKSVRGGAMKLAGSYVTITPQQEVLLKQASIPRYRFSNALVPYDPQRPRKLLLNKKEIASLYGKIHQTGLTLIPISVYTNHAKIKVELAVCRGKKAADKRSSIKEREVTRTIRRHAKEQYRMRG